MPPTANQISASFEKDSVYSTAVYSPCKSYRYSLTRKHTKAKELLLFILLNPSTATEFKNDPTIARCEKRSQLMGYNAFIICNLFAFRTKSPQIMKSCPDPIGPENNRIIEESLSCVNKVICAWGNNGIHLDRANMVMSMIKSVGTPAYHLGLTKLKQPTHPLYIDYNKQPMKFF